MENQQQKNFYQEESFFKHRRGSYVKMVMTKKGIYFISAIIKICVLNELSDRSLSITIIALPIAIKVLTTAIIETSIAIIDATIAIIETSIAIIDATIAIIETSIAIIDATIAIIETAIAIIETSIAIIDATIAIIDVYRRQTVLKCCFLYKLRV